MVNFRLRAIIPGPDYKTKRLVKELRRQLKNTQEQARRDYKTTVVTWKKKPKFFVRVSRTPEDIVVDAGTDSEFYAMLDRGTKPHKIFPNNKKVLSFNPDYVSKTQVGILKARSGGFVGNALVLANKVNHPGTAPRLWTEVIAKKTEKNLTAKLEHVVVKWVDVTHFRTKLRRII